MSAQPSQQPQKPCYQKDTNLKKIVTNPPYGDRGPTANKSGDVIKNVYTNIYSICGGRILDSNPRRLHGGNAQLDHVFYKIRP